MKAKRLIALALAAVFMLSAAATPVFAAAALPQENAALEQQNDMVSIRLKATGDLVYGSNYKLEVQTKPADTQYIGVVVGVGGEANGYVTLVLSDKIRTLLIQYLLRHRVRNFAFPVHFMVVSGLFPAALPQDCTLCRAAQ